MQEFLGIIFPITHAWNGHSVVLPSLDVDPIAVETKTTFFYVWHVITAENILIGVVFLLMSVQEDLSKVRFAAWIIAILRIIRWIVIFGSTLLHNPQAIKVR